MHISSLLYSLYCEQSRLEESSKKQTDLQQALDAAEQEAKKEKTKIKMLKTEWKREREQMKGEILQLREKLRHNSELTEETEGKLKVGICHVLLSFPLSDFFKNFFAFF